MYRSLEIFGPVFEPLRDEELFAKAEIDNFGAICSPNGADLAPDGIRKQLSSSPGAPGGASR